MNRHDKKSPCEIASSGKNNMVPMKGAFAEEGIGTRANRVRRIVGARHFAQWGVMADAGCVDPPQQNDTHGHVGTPASLTAGGWLLFHRLRSLFLVLVSCRVALNEIAVQTLNRLAAQFGFHASSGMPAIAAVRGGATCVGTESLSTNRCDVKHYKTGNLAKRECGLNATKQGCLPTWPTLPTFFHKIPANRFLGCVGG